MKIHRNLKERQTKLYNIPKLSSAVDISQKNRYTIIHKTK